VVSPLPDAKLSDVLDLEHLRRYTLMDESLERELLSLFRDQARTQYEAALTASDQDQFRFAIHTLKGTARVIGAVAVAKATETIERLRLNHIEARSHSEMRELARAIGAAETAIVSHLG
jgi:HPt (histidine-containing phosphotransfer) domain-containing protein